MTPTREEDIHSEVHLAVIRSRASGGTPCRDGIRFIEKEHGILLRSRAKNAGHVFRSFTDPHRLCFGVIYNEKFHADGIRDSLSANCLSCSRRSRKVKCQAASGCVTLA